MDSLPQTRRRRSEDAARNRRIGARLRLERLLQDIALEQMAAALDVSVSQMQKYERGATQISAASLYKAAGVLGLPIATLLDPHSLPPENPERLRQAVSFARAMRRAKDPAVRDSIRALMDCILTRQ